MSELKSYSVWDRNVRWFHWINVLCMLGLMAVGVVILNAKALGVPNDGKILLKVTHVRIGYVFSLNLLWRFIWAFFGGTHARWRAILPGGRGYLKDVGSYVNDLRIGQPRQYLGHNPLHGFVLSSFRFVDRGLGSGSGC
jgi:Ni,Fe-hydrogenase I cytochrome b subunit